jgi:hypothetical protein
LFAVMFLHPLCEVLLRKAKFCCNVFACIIRNPYILLALGADLLLVWVTVSIEAPSLLMLLLSHPIRLNGSATNFTSVYAILALLLVFEEVL